MSVTAPTQKSNLRGSIDMRIDKSRFITLYKQGMSDVQIAKAVGCSANVVVQWRSKQGLRSNRPSSSNSICWECNKAYAHLCPRFKTSERPLSIWSDWKVKKVKFLDSKTRQSTVVDTYIVYGCALFEPDNGIVPFNTEGIQVDSDTATVTREGFSKDLSFDDDTY
jgi:hypothetical protein